MRTAALRLSGTQEGIACTGTALEKRTIKTGNKAFLFLGPTDVMVKLGDSIAEAAQLASKEPVMYRIGAHGWTTIKFGSGTMPPVDRLIRWVEESHRLMAPKKPVGSKGRGKPKKSSRPSSRR